MQFNKGEHGFDNEAMNMKTIFRAVGPAFQSGLEVEPFDSVNVYALLCKLLEIEPEPHDGSLNATWPMLLESAGLVLPLSTLHSALNKLAGCIRKLVSLGDNELMGTLVCSLKRRQWKHDLC